MLFVKVIFIVNKQTTTSVFVTSLKTNLRVIVCNIKG